MGFQGDLDTFGLATIFQTLTQSQLSGTLHVYDDNSERYLVFSEGSIRTVSTGKRQNVSLGEILMARGAITQETLSGILQEQTTNGGPLGQVLIDRGICSPKDVEAALTFQLEEEVYDLFTWKGAKFEFDERRKGDTLIGPDIRICQVKVNTSGLLFEAMRRIDEWSKLNNLIPSMDIVPQITGAVPEEIKAGFTPEDRRILEFVDGANSIETITRKCCLGRYAVTQLLAKLFQSGAAAEVPADSMKTKGMAMLESGNFDGTVPLLQRYLAFQPDDIACHEALASCLEALSREREAAREYDIIAEKLCEQQNFSGAAEACGKAHDMLPRNRDILKRLANLNVLAGNEKKAGEAYLKLVKKYEEDNNLPQAIIQVTAALTDLPDDCDLLRIQARLFIENGESKRAIQSYETLAGILENSGDKAAAISVLRTIIRIDSTRKDLTDKINRLLLTESEQKQRKVTNHIAVLVILTLIGIIVFGIVNEISISSSVSKSLQEAKKMLEGLDKLSIDKQTATLTAALAKIKNAKPSFSFTSPGESNRVALELKVSANLAAASKELNELKHTQQETIELWKKLREDTTLEANEARRAFQKLIDSKFGTEEAESARNLSRKWKVTSAEKQNYVKGLLSLIANRAMPADDRFAAYISLLRKYPSTLNLKYPHGPIGLTLPSTVTIKSNSGAGQNATLIVDGEEYAIDRELKNIELPIDPNASVIIRKRGFGNIQNETTLKLGAPPTKKYNVILERAVKWRIKTDTSIIAPPLFSKDGRIVFAATLEGGIIAASVQGGSLLWPGSANYNQFPKEVFKATPLQKSSRLFVLGQYGILSCMSSKTGKIIWPERNDKSPLEGTTCMEMTATELTSIKRKKSETGHPDLLITARTGAPLFAVNSAGGRLLWPLSEAGRKNTRDKLHYILGLPYHHKTTNQILAVGDDFKLHFILEDGTHVGSTPLVAGRIRGEPIIFSHNGKPRVLLCSEAGDFYCLEISTTGAKKSEILWKNNHLRSDIISSHKLIKDDFFYAGFESGKIVKMNLTNGTIPQGGLVSGLPAPVIGQLSLDGNRIVAICTPDRNGQAWAVGVVADNSKDGGICWQLSLGKSAHSSGAVLSMKTGAIAIGTSTELICLETENK